MHLLKRIAQNLKVESLPVFSLKFAARFNWDCLNFWFFCLYSSPHTLLLEEVVGF